MEIKHTSCSPLMLGIKEAAQWGNISQNFCRQLALSGRVKAVRVGKGKILVNCNSLAEYFEKATIPEQAAETSEGIRPIPVEL